MWIATVMCGSFYGNEYDLFLETVSLWVKIYHYKKLIGIRELSERLAQDCFHNPFSLETGAPAKNILPLDEVG